MFTKGAVMTYKKPIALICALILASLFAFSACKKENSNSKYDTGQIEEDNSENIENDVATNSEEQSVSGDEEYVLNWLRKHKGAYFFDKNANGKSGYIEIKQCESDYSEIQFEINEYFENIGDYIYEVMTSEYDFYKEEGFDIALKYPYTVRDDGTASYWYYYISEGSDENELVIYKADSIDGELYPYCVARR